jgi:peptidoglycan/LPS O-acetylase OafA/YrhL
MSRYLSYGLYLYAWPVQNLIIQRTGAISPWPLFAATVLIAGALGYASWRIVERPLMGLKMHRSHPQQGPTIERAG